MERRGWGWGRARRGREREREHGLAFLVIAGDRLLRCEISDDL